MFKVIKKHTRITHQIYLKLTIKTPEQCLVLLYLTSNICLIWFYCCYCWIQINKCCLSLRNYNFNVLGNCGKYIVLLAEKFAGLPVFVFIHPTQGYKRIDFHNSASNRYVELWCVCMYAYMYVCIYTYIYIYIYYIYIYIVTHNGLKVLVFNQ